MGVGSLFILVRFVCCHTRSYYKISGAWTEEVWSFAERLYLHFRIQSEHKNTHWFQVVIKSKLTGIFLQNWWLQLHKLVQFHVVSHTLNVPPLLLLGKHRCDNLARTRLSAVYPAWPSWQRSTTCSETDGRPECPFLWLQMHPLSIKFLCHFKMDLLVGGSTLNLRLKARCTVTTLFCFMKFQHAPAALLRSERHLAFHCPLAGGRKFKNVLS